MYRDWVTRRMATEMSSFSTLLFKISITPRSFVIQSYLLVVGILQEKLIESHSSMLSGKQSWTFCLSRQNSGKGGLKQSFCSCINGDYTLGQTGTGFEHWPVFQKICFQEKKYTRTYCFHSTVISFINTFSLG